MAGKSFTQTGEILTMQRDLHSHAEKNCKLQAEYDISHCEQEKA